MKEAFIFFKIASQPWHLIHFFPAGFLWAEAHKKILLWYDDDLYSQISFKVLYILNSNPWKSYPDVVSIEVVALAQPCVPPKKCQALVVQWLS